MKQSTETRKKKSPTPTTPAATHAAVAQLAIRYDVSIATIWRWTKYGKFPQPVKLSPGCTRWRLSDVEAWEAKQGGAA